MNYTELTSKVIEISSLTTKEILEFVESQGNDEFLVDLKMIIDICEKDKDYSIKDFLELQRKFKRIAILDILSTTVKDRKLFKEIRDAITGNQLSKLEHIKNVVKNLRDYVGVSECAVKEFGEVMTPIELVEEMLDTLPAEVWTNPNLKWLDPANGVGIFPCVVVYRLMEGLKEFEPNEDLRYKHIMENMLYVCELQTKNMFIFQTGFDPYDELELNVHNGSFLDNAFLEKMKVWGVEKFDIVIGNPPYQTNTKGPKSIKIDKSFIKNSLKILIENGLLLFVTPKNNILFLNGLEVNQEKLDRVYNILHINVNDVERYFKNVSSDFCYYLVCNNNNYTNTKINNNYFVCLNYGNLLPYDMDKNKIEILSKCLNYKNDWNLKKSRIEKNLSDKANNKIVTKILSNSIEYMWTDETHKDMFKPKVLFALYGNNYIIDYDNNLFSGRSYVPYIVTKNNNESENIIKLINTKLFKFLVSCVNSMQYPFEFVLKNIKFIDFSINWSDNDLYNYFNLSVDEIELIECF